MAFKVSETIQIKQGKLDFPHYRCTNCHAKWYDSGDVIALVVSYQLAAATSTRATTTGSPLRLSTSNKA